MDDQETEIQFKSPKFMRRKSQPSAAVSGTGDADNSSSGL